MEISQQENSAPQRAGLMVRLAAGGYDVLLVMAVLVLASALVVIPFNLLQGHALNPANPWFRLYLLLLIAGFYMGFWWKGGQTLGMRAWRLQVFRQGLQPLTLKLAGLRFITLLLTMLPAGLGLWWIWFDPEGLALHDRLTGTEVIRLPKK